MKSKLALSLYKLKHKIKGIALTTELILLITAVIVLAVVAYFGMSRMILSQATYQKVTLVAIRAEAYQLTDHAVAASIWIQNTGDTPATITSVGISFGAGAGIETRTTVPPGGSVTVRPGETRVISFTVSSPLTRIPAGAVVYVFVRTNDGVEVGTAVRLASP